MKEPNQRKSTAARNLNPTAEAMFAMYHWHNQYAEQNGGSMEFWDKLNPGQQRYCVDAVKAIVARVNVH